jgi:hypothetical protein
METITNGLVTAEAVANIFNLPIGTIMPFAGDNDAAIALRNQGWLLCDGSLVSKDKFPLLDALMKNSCGGKGSDFYVPDFRGFFMRGYDPAANMDPDAANRTRQGEGGNEGNKVLTQQSDALARHQHRYSRHKADGVYSIGKPEGGYHWDKFVADAGDTFEAGTSVETRPKNVTVNYIIFAGLPKTV